MISTSYVQKRRGTIIEEKCHCLNLFHIVRNITINRKVFEISQVLYSNKKYKIIKNSRHYILINKCGEYENHGHFKKYNTCLKVIQLMERQTVPKSHYLRESVLRISTDKKYKEKVRIKVEKDAQKKMYININKGVVKNKR